MAIALVQAEQTGIQAAGTTVAATISTTTGNLLVARIHVHSGATVTISSVTDSASNTWTIIGQTFLSGSNTRVGIAYALNAAAVTSVTATLSASTIADIGVTEWSGVSGLDTSFGQGNAASTTPPASNVTTAVAGELVVSAITYGNSTTTLTLNTGSGGSAGFTALTTIQSNATVTGGGAYQVVGAAGTWGPTWTLGSSLGTGIFTAAFTPAASGGAVEGVTGGTLIPMPALATQAIVIQSDATDAVAWLQQADQAAAPVIPRAAPAPTVLQYRNGTLPSSPPAPVIFGARVPLAVPAAMILRSTADAPVGTLQVPDIASAGRPSAAPPTAVVLTMRDVTSLQPSASPPAVDTPALQMRPPATAPAATVLFRPAEVAAWQMPDTAVVAPVTVPRTAPAPFLARSTADLASLDTPNVPVVSRALTAPPAASASIVSASRDVTALQSADYLQPPDTSRAVTAPAAAPAAVLLAQRATDAPFEAPTMPQTPQVGQVRFIPVAIVTRSTADVLPTGTPTVPDMAVPSVRAPLTAPGATVLQSRDVTPLQLSDSPQVPDMTRLAVFPIPAPVAFLTRSTADLAPTDVLQPPDVARAPWIPALAPQVTVLRGTADPAAIPEPVTVAVVLQASVLARPATVLRSVADPAVLPEAPTMATVAPLPALAPRPTMWASWTDSPAPTVPDVTVTAPIRMPVAAPMPILARSTPTAPGVPNDPLVATAGRAASWWATLSATVLRMVDFTGFTGRTITGSASGPGSTAATAGTASNASQNGPGSAATASGPGSSASSAGTSMTSSVT